MRFQFDIDLTDKDYNDFNIFWQTKSYYGKKMILFTRILVSVLCIIMILVAVIGGDFSGDAILEFLPGILMLTIMQLLISPFFKAATKLQSKALKKLGKLPYSPHSVLTFYDNSFTEETDDTKTETQYSRIERISIIENKLIIIHTSSLQGYFIPAICFGSDAQYNGFKEFIKTKCAAVDTYK